MAEPPQNGCLGCHGRAGRQKNGHRRVWIIVIAYEAYVTPAYQTQVNGTIRFELDVVLSYFTVRDEKCDMRAP